jgi:hypothetical protein
MGGGGELPNDSSDIINMFTSHYQEMHVPSRDRCIARVLRATVLTMQW